MGHFGPRYIDRMQALLGLNPETELWDVILDAGLAYARSLADRKAIAQAIIESDLYWDWWIGLCEAIDRYLYEEITVNDGALIFKKLRIAPGRKADFYRLQHDWRNITKRPPETIWNQVLDNFKTSKLDEKHRSIPVKHR